MQTPGFMPPEWEKLENTMGENLPHWQCDRAIYHVSFRLADSLPEVRWRQWLAERQNILDNIAQQNRQPTPDELQRLHNLHSERIEAYLDAGEGECLLARPGVARVVADAVGFFHGQRYLLHVYCVMPNHVHTLVEPFSGRCLKRIVDGWTSFTATMINRHLGRRGRVWQAEPYDHIVRSEREYRFQFEYVWNNPGAMAGGFVRKRFDRD